jgi:spore germination protein GerM
VSYNTRKRIFTRLGLAVWAMATLVLCFVIAILVNEMLRNGQSPLASFKNAVQTEDNAAPAKPQSSTGPAGTKEIQLYFCAENGQGLAPEPATIEFAASTVENCRRAIAGLIGGPRQNGFSPILPANARLRGLYLLDSGDLVVDFASEVALAHARLKSAGMEAMLVCGIVSTVTQPALQGQDKAAVKRVRFLVEGAPPTDGFPSHLDLSQPITPDPGWIQAVAG